MRTSLYRLWALVLVTVLAACASPGTSPGSMAVRQGVIEQLTPIQIASSHHTGVGAVVGGLAGLGIGSLIGGGTGRDVAMVVGTIGGAVAGSEVANRYAQPIAGQQIVVRTSSGVLVSVVQPVNPSLRVGQRVYIEGTGQDARILPQ